VLGRWRITAAHRRSVPSGDWGDLLVYRDEDPSAAVAFARRIFCFWPWAKPEVGSAQPEDTGPRVSG